MTEAEELELLELEEEEARAAAPRPTRKTPKVGALETFVNSAGDVVPLVRPAINAASAALLRRTSGVRLTDKAKAGLAAMGVPTPGDEGFLEAYRRVRDERNERMAAGSDQNPWTSRLGTGVGIATTLAIPWLPKGPAATTGAGRVGSAALTGGGYGGLYGLTHGRADLTRGELGQAASDVVGVDGLRSAARNMSGGSPGRALLDLLGAGAVGGAFGGAAAGGLVEGARPLLAEPLRRLGVRKGKDVLQGGSDIAAPTRKPLSDDAVEEVLKSDLMGGTTPDTYAKIEGAASKLGDKYAGIVSDLEAMGVRGPEAKALAEKLMNRFGEEWSKAPASKSVPQSFADEAANMENILRPPPGWEGPAHKSLGLSQAEGLKQRLQTQARYERLANNPAEEARQEIASMVRQANEDAIFEAAQRAGPGSELANIASEFVPTKQRLGRLLEARTAAERGAVKAEARASGPGLPDYLLGATTGNPATAYITALASRSLRSRLPSMASRYSYGVSDALRTGAASPRMGQLSGLLFRDEPTEEEREQALIDALRNRPPAL